MKQYLKYIIPILIVVIVCVVILIVPKNVKPFYVEEEYYNTNGLTEIDSNKLEELINDKKSFVLFAYSNVCMFSVPCETVFEESAVNMGINILSIPLTEYKGTSLYSKVKYAPTVIIIKNGKIVDYLDSNKDEHSPLYQDNTQFENWVHSYVLAK